MDPAMCHTQVLALAMLAQRFRSFARPHRNLDTFPVGAEAGFLIDEARLRVSMVQIAYPARVRLLRRPICRMPPAQLDLGGAFCFEERSVADPFESSYPD
jgi:hypothetical protein